MCSCRHMLLLRREESCWKMEAMKQSKQGTKDLQGWRFHLEEAPQWDLKTFTNPYLIPGWSVHLIGMNSGSYHYWGIPNFSPLAPARKKPRGSYHLLHNWSFLSLLRDQFSTRYQFTFGERDTNGKKDRTAPVVETTGMHPTVSQSRTD